MSIEELVKDFEKYCPKCKGLEPDCDQAANTMYQIRNIYEEAKKNSQVYDENINLWADSLLRTCGNKKCGDALPTYINLKHYVKND